MPRHDLRLAIATAGDAKELRELQQEADNASLDNDERRVIGRLAAARRQELRNAALQKERIGDGQ